MMTPLGSVPGDDSRADEPVVIKVRDNGPYKVTGPVVIVDADGNRFPVEEGRPVALCRCGQSRTKPFCDRSHREERFEACERAVEGAERS
jgi:CDGSH-type Zn-finger protein